MTNEQNMSRRYISLDWADVEAWVKNNPRTTTNVRGGYYTACPVDTHQPDSERISVWLDDEEHVGLYCWGSCKYRDVLEAIDKAINHSASPDTEPPANNEAQIKGLEETIAAREARIEELTTDLKRQLADAEAKHSQELERALADANAKHARKLADRDSHIETLEAELPVSKSEVISEVWRLLDTQEPNTALTEAVRILGNELRNALKDELPQNQRVDRPELLDKALDNSHINEEQYEHLRLINQMRNKWFYSEVRFTKPQLRAALAYLEPIIDQLLQRSQQPER